MPFPENTPSIDELINLPAGEIAQLPVELLAAMQREIDAAAKQMKAVAARFSTALEVRYATRAAEARRACGKDTGTVHLADGEFTVIADLPKRVEWDQAKLAAMVERIRAAGDDPSEYVEISFKVPERAYAAWPEAIRQGFEPARTVKTGALKIAILPQEDRAWASSRRTTCTGCLPRLVRLQLGQRRRAARRARQHLQPGERRRSTCAWPRFRPRARATGSRSRATPSSFRVSPSVTASGSSGPSI